MPLFQKRASSTDSDSLQTSVLSTFLPVSNHPDPSFRAPKRRKCDRRGPPSLKPPSVNNLCEDLCCISTDAGASCLSRLKQDLQKRSYSAAELATHLFMFDEVDTGPPLCAAVKLLETHTIHLKDVRPTLMIGRAILELRNPETCSCRGQRNGVQGMIRFILQDCHSSERNMFLEHFLSILFQGKRNDSPIPHKKERFRLAEHVLCALREKEHQQDEDMSKVHEWVRQASLPTKATTEALGNSNTDVWTAELSGLATGRSQWEYLTYGKAEEHALINLFKALSPLAASRVYLECVHSVFHHTTTSPRLPPRAIGCWSRVVILGRRVLDLTAFADADPELRRGIQSSLNGVLTSALSLNECHEVAVLLCLIRCILIPGGSLEECSSSSKNLKHYEIWFRDFVARSHGTTLLAVLNALTQLIPREPLNLLRVNHKVLMLKRERTKLAADYLVSLRARISDLNPARARQFLSSKQRDVPAKKGLKQDEAERIEEEVIQFVLDYAKCKNIPSSLVRKMNFHRYYFRTKILKSLLDPNLGERLLEKPFNEQLMNARSFDECRIDMIKELAFNRKDKAVTATEANEAIASIVTAAAPKKTVTDPDSLSKGMGASVTEACSVQEICRALFEDGKASSNSSGINDITTNASITPSVNILGKKIEERWKSKENPVQGPELAAELLHGITSVLGEAGISIYPELFGSLLDSNPDAALRAYSSWWESHGVRLLQALRHLLDRPTGRKIQRFLQYQLLALLCTGENCLSKETAISLAMFTAALAKVGETAALMDILVISKGSSQGSFRDFLSSVITSLPLTRPDNVTISVTFALHSICLYVTLSDHMSLSGEKQSAENGSAFKENDRISFAASPVYRSMLDLLRWVSCHPWRLSAFSTKECLPYRDSIGLITFISRLLVSSRVPVPHYFTVEEYVHIEQRCGWGRIGSVYEELRKRELAGTHPTRLLCQVALFLAKRGSDGWPSVTWMEQGMMRYAEETISCCALETSDNMVSCDAPRFVERSITSEGSDVGYRLLNLYSSMRCCYLHGYSGMDVERHFTATLIPRFWPFSPPLVDYLWDCLNKNCLSWDGDQYGIKDNFLVVSNFALHGSLRRDQTRDINGLASKSLTMGTYLDETFSKRRELRRAMNELSAVDCGMGGDGGTQVVTRSISHTLLPATLAKPFGSCVVLGLAKKCQFLGSDARADQVGRWVDRIGAAVDEESMSDFLGTSLSVASLLPFTRFAEEYGRCDHVIEVTNSILTALLEGHVRLLGEGKGPFHWTRMLLPNRVVGCDDMRTNILMWLGWRVGQTGSENKCGLECLPIDVCMGRVYQNMGSLCDDGLCQMISIVGRNGVSKCLIPNILNMCQRLGSYGSRTTDLKMCKLRYEAFVEHAEILAKEMIKVVIRLLAMSRETLSGFGDEAIGELVVSYTEVRDQVISGVAAMKNCR